MSNFVAIKEESDIYYINLDQVVGLGTDRKGNVKFIMSNGKEVTINVTSEKQKEIIAGNLSRVLKQTIVL